MQVVIRQGRREDVGRITEFQLWMAMETEGIELDRETVTVGVTAVFEDPSRGGYWVAEKDGQVIGVLLTVPEWSDWRNGTVLWIHSLYVLPEFRGGGVFKRLYANLRDLVRETPELKGLRLYVDKQNGAAQAIYKRMGMSGEHYQLYEWMKEE